ncbi:hypothetical protein E7X19_10470 [Bacteroides fragilis]|nr:hypothetical protein E7X03_09950 [Bacteroides fragilis]THC74370.1 hypothetical protein E7X19_10470 [Bacteroides fragilis]THC85404.1 hypothetical protein E7X23_10160 [Bacteroides fragilis]
MAVCSIHSLPSFREIYQLLFPTHLPILYVHPIRLAVKHQQVSVARYVKV